MKHFLCMIVMLCAVQFVAAQHIFTAIIKNKEGNPVAGASVTIQSRYSGVTDSAGRVRIADIPSGKYRLVISHLSFEGFADSISIPQSIAFTVTLAEAEEEEEAVTITATRSTRTIRDIPTRVEFIAGEELDEKANMKPGDIRMVLNESTGIQVQQTSATTANASIRIQGLDGRYTQILKDGFPLYAGFSGGLGLLQTPPLDLKQAEVIKGSASTLYGGGAIAGLVNLVSKTPMEKGEALAFVNATSAGGLDVHAYYGKRKGAMGATVFAARNSNRAYDPSDADFTAIPRFERYTFNPRLYFWINKRTSLQTGVNTVFENRLGGDLHYIKGERDTAHGYFENNQSQRMSTQLSLVRTLHDNCYFTVKNSFSFFNRAIGLSGYNFNARQMSSFSEASYTHRHDNTEWIYGLSLFTDRLREPEPAPGLDRSFSQLTAGAFVQNNTRVNERLGIETGLRADHVKDYGWLLLPRISILAKWSPALTSRFGGGLGYKTPNMFTEATERLQYRSLLPVNPQENTLEKSYGLNADVNYRGRWGAVGVTANQLFFFTRISNPLLLQLNGSGLYSLRSGNGSISSRGAESNVKLSYQDFKLFLGYTFTDVRIQENGQHRQNYLTPRHRINAVLMYELKEKWKAGLEAYYFDKQLLSDGKTGAAYWNCGFMLERLWERWSVFINFENFLDARQTRNDTIFTGLRSNPQFRDIYAPLEGFVVNGGVKIRM